MRGYDSTSDGILGIINFRAQVHVSRAGIAGNCSLPLEAPSDEELNQCEYANISLLAAVPQILAPVMNMQRVYDAAVRCLKQVDGPVRAGTTEVLKQMESIALKHFAIAIMLIWLQPLRLMASDH